MGYDFVDIAIADVSCVVSTTHKTDISQMANLLALGCIPAKMCWGIDRNQIVPAIQSWLPHYCSMYRRGSASEDTK